MTNALPPASGSAGDIFARAPLLTDERLYRLVRLPAPAITAGAGLLAEAGTPFSALIVDEGEVTLVLPQEEWEQFSVRLPDIGEGGLYRLITFDAALEPSLTGFLARVSDVLARAGVPILALSAFTRDHVLVPEDHFQAAWDALRAAQQPGTAR